MAYSKGQANLKQNAVADFSKENMFIGQWNLSQEKLTAYDPFVTGYAFIYWLKTPQFFETDEANTLKYLTARNFKSFSGITDMTMDTESVTAGFGGLEMAHAVNLKKENTTFTLKHQELAGSPIRQIYEHWITGIRDPETGLATYHGKIESGTEYSAKNHTGELLYIVTDPSGGANGKSGIEFAALYTNVFPTKIPQDHLNWSNGEHGLVEMDIDFRGTFHKNHEVDKLAVQALAQIKSDTAFNSLYGDKSMGKTKI